MESMYGLAHSPANSEDCLVEGVTPSSPGYPIPFADKETEDAIAVDGPLLSLVAYTPYASPGTRILSRELVRACQPLLPEPSPASPWQHSFVYDMSISERSTPPVRKVTRFSHFTDSPSPPPKTPLPSPPPHAPLPKLPLTPPSSPDSVESFGCRTAHGNTESRGQRSSHGSSPLSQECRRGSEPRSSVAASHVVRPSMNRTMTPEKALSYPDSQSVVKSPRFNQLGLSGPLSPGLLSPGLLMVNENRVSDSASSFADDFEWEEEEEEEEEEDDTDTTKPRPTSSILSTEVPPSHSTLLREYCELARLNLTRSTYGHPAIGTDSPPSPHSPNTATVPPKPHAWRKGSAHSMQSVPEHSEPMPQPTMKQRSNSMKDVSETVASTTPTLNRQDSDMSCRILISHPSGDHDIANPRVFDPPPTLVSKTARTRYKGRKDNSMLKNNANATTPTTDSAKLTRLTSAKPSNGTRASGETTRSTSSNSALAQPGNNSNPKDTSTQSGLSWDQLHNFPSEPNLACPSPSEGFPRSMPVDPPKSHFSSSGTRSPSTAAKDLANSAAAMFSDRNPSAAFAGVSRTWNKARLALKSTASHTHLRPDTALSPSGLHRPASPSSSYSAISPVTEISQSNSHTNSFASTPTSSGPPTPNTRHFGHNVNIPTPNLPNLAHLNLNGVISKFKPKPRRDVEKEELKKRIRIVGTVDPEGIYERMPHLIPLGTASVNAVEEPRWV